MKNFLIFLAGVITGAGILYGIDYFYNTSDSGITMFDQPGECICSETLRVIQAVDGGAIAIETSYGLPIGLAVFILDKDGNGYYDGQEITIPKGQCGRQVGIYKYTNTEGIAKTLPVVVIQK